MIASSLHTIGEALGWLTALVSLGLFLSMAVFGLNNHD
jgi:hypothetical protein